VTKNEAKKQPAIKIAWCKGCGICVEFCPRNVLKIEKGKAAVKDIGSCISCGLCEQRCPDYAIYLSDGGEENGK